MWNPLLLLYLYIYIYIIRNRENQGRSVFGGVLYVLYIYCFYTIERGQARVSV